MKVPQGRNEKFQNEQRVDSVKKLGTTDLDSVSFYR